MSNQIETIIADLIDLAGKGLCHATDMAAAAEALRSYKRECIDCGEPATVTDLEAYGPGRPDDYCTVCYLANHAPGVDYPIHTSVYGEMAEVTTLLEGDTCDNCGVCTITSIKHGPEFLAADAEHRAWLLTDQGSNHPQSPLYVAPA